MSIILNIDTAIDTASISIATDGNILEEIHSSLQKDHGAFLQPAIQNLCKKTGISPGKLDAIAVSAGPGSYTGLRIGMASAKGLCYGLNKPLITIPTLEILAFEAILQRKSEPGDITPLFCPMIDARRMEVFTAIYNADLKPVLHPCSMVIGPESFANMMLKQQIIFLGNGAKKWRDICDNPNALFYSKINNILAMSKLAAQKYNLKEFANTVYAQPFYLKDFHIGPIK